MNLYQNYILIRDTYQLLKERKELYLRNKKEETPTLFQLLSKEEQLEVILADIKRKKDIELDRQISFNILLQKHRATKRLYWKNKNKSQ